MKLSINSMIWFVLLIFYSACDDPSSSDGSGEGDGGGGANGVEGCFEADGYYHENCVVSAEHQAITFSSCNDGANLNHTSLAELQGKIILLEISASW